MQQNRYITEDMMARQDAAATPRLSDADLKTVHEREHQVAVSIADCESRLEAVKAMLRWHDENRKATERLEDASHCHALVNKQYLALRSDEMKLELSDSVQELRPHYERIAERRRVIESIKEQESAIAESIETTRREAEEIRRRCNVAQERLQDCEAQCEKQQETIAAGLALNGEIRQLTSDLIKAEDQLAESQRLAAEAEADMRSRLNETDHEKKRLESLNLKRQALAVHQQLFEQFQAVNDKLQLFNTETRVNEEVHQKFSSNSLRHSEVALHHERLRKEFQTARERLEALRTDLKVHEKAINEVDSARLYHSYAEHQSRLIQLLSARKVWQDIMTGYNAIEVQRATIERLTRQYEQRCTAYELAQRDTKRLHERYTRLNKAFILLQIEQTRKLRENLKEGLPCPVCGSAHHPYHTEVEQELGETQSQLEKDYLQAKDEYYSQREKNVETAAEAQRFAGRLEAEKIMLQRMQEQQQGTVGEWQRFETLDASFAGCSPSVNREARRTTIEMIIDSENRNVEELEQKIRTFDFHTLKLRSVNEEVDGAEKKVEELQRQFWNIDTELKLVHERMESYRDLMAKSDARLEHLYKDLDDVVTLSGWRDDDLEEFSKSIAELYNDWTQTNKQLVLCEHQYALLQLRAQVAGAQVANRQQRVGTDREERDRLREMLTAKREQLRKAFGPESPLEHAAALNDSLSNARMAVQKAMEELQQSDEMLAALRGEQQCLAYTRQEQEERLRETSTTMDHAIARYNLTHSAIQTSELAALYADTRDWMLLRNNIEECRHALTVATERMKMAEEHFMALQNDVHRPDATSADETPEALKRRQAEIIVEMEALRAEQADIRHIVRRHERSV